MSISFFKFPLKPFSLQFRQRDKFVWQNVFTLNFFIPYPSVNCSFRRLYKPRCWRIWTTRPKEVLPARKVNKRTKKNMGLGEKVSKFLYTSFFFWNSELTFRYKRWHRFSFFSTFILHFFLLFISPFISFCLCLFFLEIPVFHPALFLPRRSAQPRKGMYFNFFLQPCLNKKSLSLTLSLKAFWIAAPRR